MKLTEIRILMVLCMTFLVSHSPILAQSGKAGHDQQKDIEKPNIIFILTDDQRWDALGYEGNKWVHTPEMDSLAQSGAYFTRALVTTPICAASRASIFTGLHERTHGYNFQTGAIRAGHMTLAYPGQLRASGYYTGFYGKFGVMYDEKDQLFDVYEDYDRNNRFNDRRGYYYKKLGDDTVHLTRYTGQKALDFINSAPADKPFCLSLSFSAPHAHDGAPDQYFWQPETDELLRDVQVPGPRLADDQYFAALPEAVKRGFNRLRWTWRFDTPEKYQHSVKGYYRMISGIDLEIGKIRQLLRKKGLDKKTAIIVMGDNGYFLGERQLAGKWLLYDNSVRVPLIIYDPRVNTHRNIDVMALNIDVPATILDLAGTKAPKSWQGTSLLPLVKGSSSRLNRDTVLIEHIWEFEDIPPSEGIRTKDWKYFRYVNDKSIEALFDLGADPDEINNLASDKDHQTTLHKFRRKTDDLIEKYKDPYAGVPSNLKVEFIPDSSHTRMHVYRPRYGWVNPKETVKQSGYQILVASSKANIDNNIGDVWNSGQVRNADVKVNHGGTEIKAGRGYYWKVRVWDQDNRLGAYSAAQLFTK